MHAHTPVLLDEVLDGLAIRPDGRYIDATFGRGGHSAAVLARLSAQGELLAIDRDSSAVTAARERFGADSRFTVIHGSFSQLEQLVAQSGRGAGWDGVLLDLGVSSPQLDDAARGFSFMQDGPLDMRMNTASGTTAAQWLARVPERDLERVIRDYGEERFARRIAHAIVEARRTRPLDRTLVLAEVVSAAVPRREPGKHPATRTFQAIRIHINDEFAEIEAALRATLSLLKPGGRLCVISFHSLEDTLVKRFIQQHSQDDPVYAGLPDIPEHARARLKRVGRTIHPAEAEVARNPRARSAVLRIAERRAA
ncbi:MAG: 16S rRNA (cytosine(1402)-N(4))-methyltransferase RsmH [Steroidobacteraceae bacterium]